MVLPLRLVLIFVRPPSCLQDAAGKVTPMKERHDGATKAAAFQKPHSVRGRPCFILRPRPAFPPLLACTIFAM
jgi:hypothetical protein